MGFSRLFLCVLWVLRVAAFSYVVKKTGIRSTKGNGQVFAHLPCRIKSVFVADHGTIELTSHTPEYQVQNATHLRHWGARI